MQHAKLASMPRTSVRDLDLRGAGAVPLDRVEVPSFAVHHAAIPARIAGWGGAEVAHEAGAAGAVKGVLVGPWPQKVLLAEAVHAGAAICEGWVF
jgi:hypothetical protein